MAGVTLQNFRLFDPNGNLRLEAKEATIAQMPWRILLRDVRMPGDGTQQTSVGNLHLEGPEEGKLIFGQKSYKIACSLEPRTDHENK